MTKKEMLKTIEKSKMVIDFNFNYLMRTRNKEQIKKLYEQAVQFQEKKG